MTDASLKAAYYNDNDPFACRVLRKQIAAGNLPPGDVDDRDIREVEAGDLIGYRQIHLFAGIGGFPLGLRRAGVPDDFPICTGGDPCQGNSKARGSRRFEGEGPAVHFLRIVDALRPPFVLRENPSSTRRNAPWPWHRFRGGLESLGYAVLPFRLRSCCVGHDQQRCRLYLLAELSDPVCPRLEGEDDGFVEYHDTPRLPRRRPTPRVCRRVDGLHDRLDRIRCLGNAVDPAAVEFIGRLILSSINVNGA